VLVLSPHTPRARDAWGLVEGTRLTGDLGRFRHPGVAIDLPAAQGARELVHAAAGGRTARLPAAPLDHGAVVPLWFLAEAGWTGPTAVLAWGGDPEALGRALAAAATATPERWAILASGDMSHRLQPGAPSGFDPRAKDFDAAVVTRLRAFAPMSGIDAELRALAAEDVVTSVVAAEAAVGGAVTGRRVLAYEGPFGVGYCEAVLYDAAGAHPYVALARSALDAWAAGTTPGSFVLPPELEQPRPVFVGLYERSGRLRGCIGHLAFDQPSLAAEIARTAVLAATADRRFAPVTPAELPELTIKVDVLGPPEPIAGPEALDPRRYGVVVRRDGRRGVLLPDLPGVDTPARQLEIARQKAGIPADAAVTLERFEVVRYAEVA
jgi:AmmeMemoRadiSam system protein A